jgi:uncharacterized membrane protein
VTGYLLMLQLNYALNSRWFIAVATFYILAGMCWVYLVKAELKLRELVAELPTPLPPQFHALARRWQRLALGSFLGVLAIFWLMVYRPGL